VVKSSLKNFSRFALRTIEFPSPEANISRAASFAIPVDSANTVDSAIVAINTPNNRLLINFIYVAEDISSRKKIVFPIFYEQLNFFIGRFLSADKNSEISLRSGHNAAKYR
jgi:hypothetical protein